MSESLREVTVRLSEFYTQEEALRWLHAPHPQLNGDRAIDVIHDGRGDEVLAVLDRLNAGAYI